MNKMNVFKGSDEYVVTNELMNAVNVSIALQKPLLIKGEPGQARLCWRKPYRSHRVWS